MARVVIAAVLLALPAMPHAAETAQKIVRNGITGGAGPCGVCHEENGRGKPGLGAPRLAGQYGVYLLEQLLDFASGDRPDPIMTPVSRSLSEEQMASLADYFSSQRASVPPYPPVLESEIERGRQIAYQGLDEPRVQACADCHGSEGHGMLPNIPELAGQAPGYLEEALREFRSGHRKSDELRIMRQVASGLSDEDIKAVASYFSTLPPQGEAANADPVIPGEEAERP